MDTQTHTDAIVEALDRLIEVNRDTETGYWTAAEGVANESALQTLFHRFAQQRARFAADLEQEVRTYGGEPSDKGTVGGSLRRGWLHIKAAVTGGDETAVLAECERSEQIALESYEDALREDLPEYLKETLHQQHDEVLEVLQQLRALKDARSAR